MPARVSRRDTGPLFHDRAGNGNFGAGPGALMAHAVRRGRLYAQSMSAATRRSRPWTRLWALPFFLGSSPAFAAFYAPDDLPAKPRGLDRAYAAVVRIESGNDGGAGFFDGGRTACPRDSCRDQGASR